MSGQGNNGTILGNGASVADGVLTLPSGAADSGAGHVRSGTGTFPAQYWLLNPRNPASRYKSVITNGNTPSAPWGTEYGISPTNGSQGSQAP